MRYFPRCLLMVCLQQLRFLLEKVTSSLFPISFYSAHFKRSSASFPHHKLAPHSCVKRKQKCACLLKVTNSTIRQSTKTFKDI